ncbi:biopolymer transporter ExbD [Ascidiaceihabitans sp.]|uniref:ExbD/TolR family protein n=1 Tax=Ascidiaceihabitans sp. TaxID=1872644 RepID=UPI0032997FD8
MPLKAERRRRKLSMTSLIDVIFLLLLFFMLSSTFSRFSEVELQAASGSANRNADTNLAFLRVNANTLSLNGRTIMPSDLNTAVKTLHLVDPIVLLVNVDVSVSAQQLADVLVSVRGIPNLPVSVMGAS